MWGSLLQLKFSSIISFLGYNFIQFLSSSSLLLPPLGLASGKGK